MNQLLDPQIGEYILTWGRAACILAAAIGVIALFWHKVDRALDRLETTRKAFIDAQPAASSELEMDGEHPFISPADAANLYGREK